MLNHVLKHELKHQGLTEQLVSPLTGLRRAACPPPSLHWRADSLTLITDPDDPSTIELAPFLKRELALFHLGKMAFI